MISVFRRVWRGRAMIPGAMILGALILSVTLAAPAQAKTEKEAACFDLVQGKVAWNQNGATTWQPHNVDWLCKGVQYPYALVDCFNVMIEIGQPWNKAIGYCQDAMKPIETSIPKVNEYGERFEKLEGVLSVVCYRSSDRRGSRQRVEVFIDGQKVGDISGEDCQSSTMSFPAY